MNNIINFKGVKEGLVLKINPDSSFEEIIDTLVLKSKNKNSLLENSNLVGISGKVLSYENKAELEKLLINLFKINVLSLEKFSYNSEIKTKCKNDTIFVENTLRSGMEIESEGNIVVLGDVNPGAVLKAKGNIIVLGKLRGIAHAGIDGDNGAFISANILLPNQIRISNTISRSPDNNSILNEEYLPEKAYLSENRIVIEKI